MIGHWRRGDALTDRLVAVALAGLLLTLAAIGLSSCSGVSVAKIEPVLSAACGDAMALAPLAGLVPGAAGIVPFIVAGCATEAGLAKLAADPRSVEWLGELRGKIKGLASVAHVKL